MSACVRVCVRACVCMGGSCGVMDVMNAAVSLRPPKLVFPVTISIVIGSVLGGLCVIIAVLIIVWKYRQTVSDKRSGESHEQPAALSTNMLASVNTVQKSSTKSTGS